MVRRPPASRLRPSLTDLTILHSIPATHVSRRVRASRGAHLRAPGANGLAFQLQARDAQRQSVAPSRSSCPLSLRSRLLRRFPRLRQGSAGSVPRRFGKEWVRQALRRVRAVLRIHFVHRLRAVQSEIRHRYRRQSESESGTHRSREVSVQNAPGVRSREGESRLTTNASIIPHTPCKQTLAVCSQQG